jgi:hypothetical protein
MGPPSSATPLTPSLATPRTPGTGECSGGRGRSQTPVQVKVERVDPPVSQAEIEWTQLMTVTFSQNSTSAQHPSTHVSLKQGFGTV